MTVPNYLFPMNLQYFAETQETDEKPVEEVVQESKTSEQDVQVVEKATEKVEPVEPVVPASELEALKQKLTELENSKAELENKIAEKDNEVSATTNKVSDYESALTKIVDQRLTGIPETIKALMPENLSVAEKLTWVEKAEAAIPAKEEKAEEVSQPVIETIGQPTPVKTEIEVDLKDLTASQKLSNYFQEFFGK